VGRIRARILGANFCLRGALNNGDWRGEWKGEEEESGRVFVDDGEMVCAAPTIHLPHLCIRPCMVVTTHYIRVTLLCIEHRCVAL